MTGMSSPGARREGHPVTISLGFMRVIMRHESNPPFTFFFVVFDLLSTIRILKKRKEREKNGEREGVRETERYTKRNLVIDFVKWSKMFSVV